MKIIRNLAALFLLLPFFLSAQITWTPYFASHSDSVTVIFDATQGNAGLLGYTGDVYAHTGVITSASTSNSDWKYVKTNWGVNTPETKLTRIGTDLYEFKIKPSVRSFYGVPANESILKIAFVFRSSASPYREGKTAEGGDIFVNLSTGGLDVAITLPESDPTILALNGVLPIQALSTGSTNLALYIDGAQVGTTSSLLINYDYTGSSAGKKWVKAVATSSTGSTKADSLYIVVRPPVTVQALPANIKDGVNYTSVTSVTLSLYAPGKEYIYIIGDFTNWQVDPNLYMKKTPEGNRFWAEVPGLSPGVEYGFQYLVDGTLRVTDPYVDKVLDPWNDRYISNAVYPGLKQYPTGKTSGIVGVVQTAQSAYQWQNTGFTRPAKTDLVIYELLIRDFTTARTYQSVIDTLSYLKRLGINAIQLMPVMEFEGNESWGYNPMFMFAPDKYYGPKNKLKELIDKAHGMGMAVILDIVLNHQFGLSPLVRLWWDSANNQPAANSPYFNQVARHPFNVGYDFNHESQATKDFVDRVNTYWLTEYKVDGFRYDLSKGFTQTNSGSNVGQWGQYDQSRINLLKRMSDVVWQTDPSAYVILEHFADNSEETVLANYGTMLWSNHNHSYNEATMGWLANSDFSWISWKNKGWQQPHGIGYMESHDEERLMYKNLQYGNASGSYSIKNLAVALNRQKLAAAFFFTVPGPKMIWQFGELGFDLSINYPCGTDACRLSNKPPKWDYLQIPERVKLNKVYSALANLKVNYPAFRTNDFSIAGSGAVKKIHLYHSSMNVVVIGNFDVNTQSGIPVFPNAGTWYNYFDGTSMNVTDPNMSLQLQPGEFRIYTSVQLPAPEPGLLTGTEEIAGEIPSEYALSQNFPNPFNPETVIRFAVKQADMVTIDVYDVMGSKVASVLDEYKTAGTYEVSFDASGLSSGVYFYRMTAGGFSELKKLVVLK